MGKRLSLIVDDDDEAVVSPYVTPGTPEHAALQRWAGARGSRVSTSEASALRALLRAGAEQLRGEILADGYECLAGEWNADPDGDADRRAARRRYARRTDAAIDD